MSDIFEKNIAAIIKKDMALGVQLFALQDKGNEKYDVYLDENDNANINIIDISDKENPIPLYKAKPVDETLSKINEMDEYSKYPYLYFYGIGNGIFYNLMLKNEKHQRIVIIEPEIELLFIALHFNDFSKDLSSGRLMLKLSNQINFTSAGPILGGNTKIYFKAYKLEVLSDYYMKYGDNIRKVNQDFAAVFRHKVIGLGNDSIDALLGLEHHIMNLENMVKTPKLMNLVDNMKTSNMAVIVSTGPSLTKQIPLLKKIQDHVTIISVDASLPILHENGIQADVATSIERVTLTAKFFQRIPKEYQEKIIFALTSVQDKLIFRSIEAGQIQLSMRPFGYTKYFKLKDWGYVGHGMSSANMAFEFAFNGLFEQVVWIGQDLAYGNDGTSHAKKHTFGENEVAIKDNSDVNAKFIEAYGGNGKVQTTMVWEMFKNFFEFDIAEAKRTDEIEQRKRNYINCTEGGARIQGTEEMPFSKAVDMYVDFSNKKKPIKLKYPTQNQINNNIKKVRKKIEFMLKYYKKVETRTEKTFLEVHELCKKLDEIDAKNNIDKLDKKIIKKMDSIRVKINKVKEYFEDKSFSMVLAETLSALMIHQETEIALLQIRNIKTEEDRLLQLVEWMYVHKYWLFSFAGAVRATFDTVLFGINEETSLDFLKDMVKKHTDYSFDEFMFLKNKFFIGKRLWLYFDKDDQFKVRTTFMMQSIAQKMGYKEFNKTLKEEFFIDNDIVMVGTPEDKLAYRPKLIEFLSNLQNRVLKDNIDTSKKTVALYVLDEYPWISENLDSIKETFENSNCNFIIARERAVAGDEDNCKELYSFGMNATKHLSNVDYVLTVKHRYAYDFVTKETNLDDSKVDITIDGVDIKQAKQKVEMDLINKATAHGFNKGIDMVFNDNTTPIYIDKTNFKSKIDELISSL
jgi:hypothetical protein